MNGHQKRTLLKRQNILTATKQLLKVVPISHITIHDISSKANVSQVTIYNLFASKNLLIREALKEMSYENVHLILDVLNSDLPFCNRLKTYLRTSFQSTINTPQVSALLAHMFSGIDQELTDYVAGLYASTYSGLEKLYKDGLREKHIRLDLELKHFHQLLEIYTQIHPKFYTNPQDMEQLLTSLLHSFS